MKLLVRNYPDLDIVYRGRTALKWASEKGHERIVKLLTSEHARKQEDNDIVVNNYYHYLNEYLENLGQKLHQIEKRLFF